MVKEVASNTSMNGDGTTTATVLASHHSRRFEGVSSGRNPMDIKRGIDKAVIVPSRSCASSPSPADPRRFAQSARSGELRRAIARPSRMRWKRSARKASSPLRKARPRQRAGRGRRHAVRSRYLSPYFINTQQNQTAELEKPYILLSTRRSRTSRDAAAAGSRGQGRSSAAGCRRRCRGRSLATLVVTTSVAS